ncbi:MAG: DUF3211 domain-containing protein [Metallosphaera sp.]
MRLSRFIMIKSITVPTSHDPQSLFTILSDPVFVLPRLFPPIKQVNLEKDSFNAEGRFMLMRFSMHGNVLRGNNITYVFTLGSGNETGNGKLVIELQKGSVSLRFEYDGWMERTSGLFMGKWFTEFGSKLDEEVRLERIKRKI